MKTALLLNIIFLCVVSKASAQWTPLTTGSSASYESIFFFGADTGWASSAGNVIRTTNGGTTWSATSGVYGFRDVEFANHTVGFTAGVVANSIKKSTDGGITWSQLTPVNSNSLWGVSVVSSSIVYVCGTGGVVWKTTNGGTSFSAVNIPTTDLIPDLDFVDANTGFAVDQLSKIWKTTNGGSSWTTVFSSTGIIFTSIYFVNSFTGFAIGINGVVVRTTDGGSNWTQLTTGSTAALQYVHFCDPDNGMAVGFGGAVIRTNDGGNSWFPEDAGTTVNLYSCYMISPTVAIVAGDSGVMKKNTNLISSLNEVNQPGVEIGAYPNPFLSSTCISISGLASHQNVMLQLFSINGELLKVISFDGNSQVIIGENLCPGSYLYAIRRDEKVIGTGKIVKNL